MELGLALVFRHLSRKTVYLLFIWQSRDNAYSQSKENINPKNLSGGAYQASTYRQVSILQQQSYILGLVDLSF